MQHTRIEQVPATTREVVDKVTCDLCGATISQKPYSAEEVQINHCTGDRFPEGGSGTDTGVDMCGKCFEEKLVPWLRSQGAEPRTTEWEF